MTPPSMTLTPRTEPALASCCSASACRGDCDPGEGDEGTGGDDGGGGAGADGGVAGGATTKIWPRDDMVTSGVRSSAVANAASPTSVRSFLSTSTRSMMAAPAADMIGWSYMVETIVTKPELKPASMYAELTPASMYADGTSRKAARSRSKRTASNAPIVESMSTV